MGLFDFIKYAEPALTLGSSAIAEPIAGWAGILSGGDAGIVNQARNALTYQTRTQEGQQSLNALANALKSGKETLVDNNPPINAIAKALREGTDYVGDRYPMAGAALATLPTAAMLLLGPGSSATRQALSNVGRDAGKGIIGGAMNAYENAGATPTMRGPLASQHGSIGDQANDMRLFHGTSGDHQDFSSSYAGSVSSGDGRGIWFTKSRPYAWEYAENAAGKRGGEPRIMEGRSMLENPLVVNFDDYGNAVVNGKKMDWKSNSDAIDYALKNKNDGIDWVRGSFTDDPSITFLDRSKLKIVDQGLD